jgi:hypothetical protein
VRDTQPNTTHFALAALQYTSHISRIITQVSSLRIIYRMVHRNTHNLSDTECRWFTSKSHPGHPTLFSHPKFDLGIAWESTCKTTSSVSDSCQNNLQQRVHCSRGHVTDRGTFQDQLSAANPQWHQYLKEVELSGVPLRTNPDGDVSSYNIF